MKVMRKTHEQIKGLIDLIEFLNLKEATMLEVGSYLGESTKIFAQSNSFLKIHCLDLWQGGYDRSDYASENMHGVEKIFMDFKNEFDDMIEVHKKHSSEIKNIFKDDYFDFIYIDAGHSYESVKSDILSCLPKLKKNCFIGGHDYGYHLFSVQKAVNEILGYPDMVFADTSWIKKIS